MTPKLKVVRKLALVHGQEQDETFGCSVDAFGPSLSGFHLES